MEKNKLIIYAEDVKSLRDMAGDFFKELLPDYDIELYEDGTSLDGRLEKDVKNVGIVLTDNEMPGINGNEIIKRYSRKEGFENIPFILIYAGAEDIGEEALRNGASAYFIKPVSYVDIAKVVERILGGSKK
ncbi:response regulator [Candidatus Pacearchaeota archaeon]|nr:response regulator [Candidatus Pacearchaeota archaeon]